MHIAPNLQDAVGFDVPLDMLSACHARVERHCALLTRLLDHVAQHGADADARDAAQQVLRYFDTAALQHHADEEKDLFPALLDAVAGSDAVCIRELTEALAAQHRELETAWAHLRAGLQAIAAGDAAGAPAADAAQHFTRVYTAHIEREERELLPMARRLLDDAQLRALGHAMQRRRGLAG